MIKLNVKKVHSKEFDLIGNVQLKDNTVVMIEHDLTNFNVLDTKVENDVFKMKISTVSSKAEFEDMKYLTIDDILGRFVSINFGIIDIRGIEPTVRDESYRPSDEMDNIRNKTCTVTYPKGLIEKIENAGITNFRKTFYSSVGYVISSKYSDYNLAKYKEIRQFNRESLFSFMYLHPIMMDKVTMDISIDNILHFIIDPLVDLPRYISEEEKKYADCVFRIISNLKKESPEYVIMSLQNLSYRFSKNANIILPLILISNALEIYLTESQAHEYSYGRKPIMGSMFTNIERYVTRIGNKPLGENVFYRFNENNMIGGQSIGNYTTSLVNNTRNESPIVMDNDNKDMKLVTDDNLKTFLYKDIALSLASVKNRIEDMETEEDRQKLVKEVDELANKILDARVRLNDSKTSLIEFDGLDDELKDTKFDITNFNIYSSEAVASKESFGVIAVNDYFSFGEINPYNINNPTNIKDPLKKVAKRAYVHTENIVVTAVKFIFGVLRRNIDQFGADLFYASKKVGDLFSGIFGKVNLLLGASYPVNSYGARTHVDNIRAVRNKFDTAEKRNKRYKDWQEAKLKAKEKIMSTFTDLTYNEDYPLPIEEEYRFVKVPIEIDMTSSGEADLIKDVMAKKIKMSFGIKRLLLSKSIKAVNKKLKGKKVDKAMKDKLELENTRHKEMMQKALRDKKISKKDYDWFTSNCMYDTKGLKVVESKN